MGSAMTRMVFHGQDWVSELTSFIGHTVPFHLLPLFLPTTNYAETERLVGRPTDRRTRRRNGKGRTEREGQRRRQTIGCKWNYLSSPPLPLSFLPFVFLFLSPRRERGTWSVNSPDRREGVTPTGRRLLTQHPPRPIRCTCALRLRSALPSINAMKVLFRCMYDLREHSV